MLPAPTPLPASTQPPSGPRSPRNPQENCLANLGAGPQPSPDGGFSSSQRALRRHAQPIFWNRWVVTNLFDFVSRLGNRNASDWQFLHPIVLKGDEVSADGGPRGLSSDMWNA